MHLCGSEVRAEASVGGCEGVGDYWGVFEGLQDVSTWSVWEAVWEAGCSFNSLWSRNAVSVRTAFKEVNREKGQALALAFVPTIDGYRALVPTQTTGGRCRYP